jgi:nitroreductase
MSNPVLTAIAERRSIRAYKPEAVTEEELSAVLKAAQESPSARNTQPWHFTVVRNSALLTEINAEAVKNFNLDREDIFYGAPLAIFISCEAESRWGRLDCGIAVATMALAAHSLGLGSVILGLPEGAFAGDRKDYFNKLLKFPDGYSFAVAIAIGRAAATKDAHPFEPGRIDYVD